MASSLIFALVLAALGAMASEISRAVPLLPALRRVAETGRRAMTTLARSHASEHWKERAMRAYALRMLLATASAVGMMALVLGPVIVVATLLEQVLLPGLMAFALAPLGLGAATLGAFLPILLRRRGRTAPASAYSPVEKALHALALGSGAIAEASFDFDQAMTRSRRRDPSNEAHVFVVGLARSGTTALMRSIHESGAFRSLLYDDMPFVLAPNLWQRLRGNRRRQRSEAVAERAHGDGVMVNAHSPESLDEVFWRVFDGRAYIGPQALAPHDPAPALRQKFRDYVAAILAADPGQRYLSKNNNNLLRLGALRETFPQAHILVLMRHPLDHAASLWRQHQNFTAQQARDPFVGRYMGWLAHHEFGADHRPFAPDAARGATPDQFVYWLRQWSAVYQRLLDTLPDDVRLVCYETLCDDPAEWASIAASLGIEPGAARFRRPVHQQVDIQGCEVELRHAEQIYQAFRSRSETAAVGAAVAAQSA